MMVPGGTMHARFRFAQEMQSHAEAGIAGFQPCAGFEVAGRDIVQYDDVRGYLRKAADASPATAVSIIARLA
jgi:hypothetical protein